MKIPNLVLVEKSFITSIGHNTKRNILFISFVKGGCYRYFNVSEETFKSFKESKSKGKFYHQHKNEFGKGEDLGKVDPSELKKEKLRDKMEKLFKEKKPSTKTIKAKKETAA